MLEYHFIGALELTGNPLAYGASEIHEMIVPDVIPAGSLIYVGNAQSSALYTVQFLGDTMSNTYVAAELAGAMCTDCIQLNIGQKLRFQLTNFGSFPSETVANAIVYAFAVAGDTVRMTTTPGTLVTADGTGSSASLGTIPRTRTRASELTALRQVVVVGVELFGPSLGLTCGDVSRSMSGPDFVFDVPYACATAEAAGNKLLRILAVGRLLMNVTDVAEYDVTYEWQPDPVLIGTDFTRTLLYIYEEIPNTAISLSRSPLDRRMVAAVGNDTQAQAHRYSDAVPEVAGTAITVDAGATQSVAVQFTRSTRLFCLFCQSGEVGMRRSDDQGRTWSGVITVASGYEDLAFWADDRTGIWAVALYKQSENKWYLSVGTLNEAGDTWSFSSPTLLASNARRAGDIQRRSDGVWEFGYINIIGTAVILTCRSLSTSGAGSWI